MAVWILLEKGELTVFHHSWTAYAYGAGAAACDLIRIYMLVRAASTFKGSHHNVAIVQTFTVAVAIIFDCFILDDMLQDN
jgi:hypothetical protein